MDVDGRDRSTMSLRRQFSDTVTLETKKDVTRCASLPQKAAKEYLVFKLIEMGDSITPLPDSCKSQLITEFFQAGRIGAC